MLKDKDIIADETSFGGSSKATHPGKLGDHPLGGTAGAMIGAAAGGAIAGAMQGATTGALGGVPGLLAGVAVGTVAGALAGKGAAQIINPTTEDEYWSKSYQDRPYVVAGETYEVYKPAYHHGVDSFSKYEGRHFTEVESDIATDWATRKDTLPWEKAKPAARDAYERLYNANLRDKDVD